MWQHLGHHAVQVPVFEHWLVVGQSAFVCVDVTRPTQLFGPHLLNEPTQVLHFVTHALVTVQLVTCHCEVTTVLVQLDTDFLFGTTTIEVRLREHLDAGATGRHLCVSLHALEHFVGQICQHARHWVTTVVQVDPLHVSAKHQADTVEAVAHEEGVAHVVESRPGSWISAAGCCTVDGLGHLGPTSFALHQLPHHPPVESTQFARHVLRLHW